MLRTTFLLHPFYSHLSTLPLYLPTFTLYMLSLQLTVSPVRFTPLSLSLSLSYSKYVNLHFSLINQIKRRRVSEQQVFQRLIDRVEAGLSRSHVRSVIDSIVRIAMPPVIRVSIHHAVSVLKLKLIGTAWGRDERGRVRGGSSLWGGGGGRGFFGGWSEVEDLFE